MRQSVRSMARPDLNLNFAGSSQSSGGSSGKEDKEKQICLPEDTNKIYQDKTIVYEYIFEPSCLARSWEKFQSYDETKESIEKTKEKENEYRWNYFWYCFYAVHKPSEIFGHEVSVRQELSSSAIELTQACEKFYPALSEEISTFLSFINLWKFLREELYALLNIGLSNPIAAYVTHTCELSSVNNPYQKFKSSLDEESLEQTLVHKKHELEFWRKKNEELSFSIPELFV